MDKTLYSLPRTRLGELLALISSAHQLYVPMRKAEQLRFTLVDDDASLQDMDVDQLLGSVPVKELFFPQVQDIASFKRQGKSIAVTEHRGSTEPFVVFGVRGCDVRGLEVLDRVFTGPSGDAMYTARRSSATVVSLACNEPEQTCFCSIFGIDAAEPGSDVTAWLTEDTLYWQPGTEKGMDLTAQVSAMLKPCKQGEPEELASVKGYIREVTGSLPMQGISLDRFTPEALQDLFDDPAWQKLSSPCIGCGTCTFVCPTCQCFDIRDYDTGNGIERFRCWDSCMYSDFTSMAHGNPRTTQVERFRQRFMHKLVYYPANYDGEYSCTGCGRCLSACPNSMHMVKVMDTLGGAEYV